MSLEHEFEDMKRKMDMIGTRQDLLDRVQAAHEERSKATINMYKDLKEIVVNNFLEIKTLLSGAVTQNECLLKERNFDAEKESMKGRIAKVEEFVTDHKDQHERNNRQTIVVLAGWIFTIGILVFQIFSKKV